MDAPATMHSMTPAIASMIHMMAEPIHSTMPAKHDIIHLEGGERVSIKRMQLRAEDEAEKRRTPLFVQRWMAKALEILCGTGERERKKE